MHTYINRRSNVKKVYYIVFVLMMVVCWMVFFIIQQNLKSKSVNALFHKLVHMDCSQFIHDGNISKLIILFKTDCSFSIQLVDELIQKEDMLDGVEFLLISSEPSDSIKDFSLNHYSEKTTYLCDETTLFSKELNVKRSPTIFIYSGKSQKITKRFVGAVSLEQILREFNHD